MFGSLYLLPLENDRIIPFGVYSRGCAHACEHECVVVRVPLCVRRVRVCMLLFHYVIVSHVAITLHRGIICELPFQLFCKIPPSGHPVLSATPRSQRLWRRLSMRSSSWLSSFAGSAGGATSDRGTPTRFQLNRPSAVSIDGEMVPYRRQPPMYSHMVVI